MTRFLVAALVPFLLPPLMNNVDAEGGEKRELFIAFSPSITPDREAERVQAFTRPFLDLVSKKMGDVTLTATFPDHYLMTKKQSLEKLGKSLHEADEFQICVMWGLEYGWLRNREQSRSNNRESNLQLIAIPIPGNDINVTSLVLVSKERAREIALKKEAAAKKKESDPSGGEGKPKQDNSLKIRDFLTYGNGQFRLARYDSESIIQEIHHRSLLRGYDDQSIQSSPSMRIRNAFRAIRNGRQDGLLIDEYTLTKKQEFYSAVKEMQAIGDWGDEAISPKFPPAAIVANRSVLGEEMCNRLRAAIIECQSSEEGKPTLNGWLVSKFIEPSANYDANARSKAKKYDPWGSSE